MLARTGRVPDGVATWWVTIHVPQREAVSTFSTGWPFSTPPTVARSMSQAKPR
jgi:hypothetical protein